MTDNRILQRYTRTERDDSDANDLGEVDDLGPFGFLRGVKDRAAMLELRLKDGNSVAFDYGWLRKVEFNPSEGLTLHFGGADTVRILGRSLNRVMTARAHLLRGILCHRVPWIKEASEPDLLQAPPEATIIEQITITPPNR